MDTISNLNGNIKTVYVTWTSQTTDGLFGTIKVMDGCGDYNKPCVTNLEKRIEDGTYSAKCDISPHLGYLCPHIQVPLRDIEAGGDAGIRIHKGNVPAQSLGCIFPGTTLDGDALDNSTVAFDSLMALLPQDGSEFQVIISTTL